MRLVVGGVVDLLEDPGDGGDHGRADHRQFLGETGEVSGEAGRYARLEAEQQRALGERMGERQEQQPAVVRTDLRADRVDDLRHVRAQVAMGEHAPLRAAGGPRRVDDRRQVVRSQCRRPSVDHVVVDRSPEFGQPVEPGHAFRRRDREHLATRRRAITHRVVECAQVVVLDDRNRSAAVLEDPGELFRRGRLVHGHRDGPGRHDRQIGEHPLEPGVRHERDAVPWLDATGHEPLGGRSDLFGGLRDGPVDEVVARRSSAITQSGSVSSNRCSGRSRLASAATPPNAGPLTSVCMRHPPGSIDSFATIATRRPAAHQGRTSPIPHQLPRR